MKHARLGLLVLGLLVGCSRPPRASGSAAPQPSTLRQLYGVGPTQRLNAARTALLLVDFQEEFFHGRLAIANAAEAASHAATLLGWARTHGIKVVHVRNVTKPGSLLFAPESPTTAIVSEVMPRTDELVLSKPTGGAFTKTSLDAILRAQGIDTVVVAGIMAHLAVAMTAQDAAVLDYHVVVASDATTTRNLPGAAGTPVVDQIEVQRAALAAIADRFADVLSTDEILRLPLAR